MEITKAKVTKDNTLVATYTDETGTITVEGKNLVTNDLINAFKALVPHMAFLCEQKEADGKEFLEDMPDNIDSILERIGYDDRLVDKAEIFHLWVIEAPESVAAEFPADKAGLNVLFVPSEAPYHARKVTLLNGPHTVLSPVGYLSGLDTVKECVEDPLIGKFVKTVMFDELLETLDLPRPELEQFAHDVLERFVNPYVKHFVTSIMLNSFPKYRTRDLPGLKTYLERKGILPKGLVLGLAGIVTYYKGGKRGDTEIIPNDDKETISLLQRLWATGDTVQVAEGVLGATEIWGEDLNMIPGLTAMLNSFLETIQEKGMRAAVESVVK